MTTTPKQRALWSGVIAAASGFIAWLANTPPEQQDALLGPLVSAMPVSWRPSIGAAMKLLSSVAVIYSTVQASHAGPATPPANSTVTGEPLSTTKDIDHKTIGTLLAILGLFFAGCAGLPQRTYSLSYTDKQGGQIGAGVTLGDTRGFAK